MASLILPLPPDEQQVALTSNLVMWWEKFDPLIGIGLMYLPKSVGGAIAPVALLLPLALNNMLPK
jgi:hypothetical protein